MKFAIDSGHCPKSTGASGHLDELTENRRVTRELVAQLKALGHEVVDVTPADSEAESLTGRARRANNAGADFFISCHFNAGGGTGCEVYTTPASGAKKEAAAVAAAIAKALGIANRGHKTARFTVLAKTNMPAILVEVCFVDNKTDADAYRASTPATVAAAIVAGVTGGAAPQPAQKQEAEPEPETKQEQAPSGDKPEPEEIDEDGKFGSDTILKLQYALDAPYKDGIISRQAVKWRDKNPGLTTGWEWQDGVAEGSQTIALLQRKIGAKADGVFGAETAKALQRYLGTYVDGVISYPSKCVKELQRRLNNGTF